MKRVLLHLVHGGGQLHPSRRHGYDIVAPLDEDGRLNTDLWRSHWAYCRVIRFWGDSPSMAGMLRYRPAALEEEGWFLDFDPNSKDDDQFGYRLDIRKFMPGGYLSLHDRHDDVCKFQIVNVSELPAQEAPASRPEAAASGAAS
ncbi:hypothetical protein [Hansschlegelia beijingensis]|uniref:Uncharacterized protein n=1 Tax=Hansschlegelia beijingensis TaxID=1133344 RepID=A0A7W6CW01_9HYPH|nr:hypothetical protein [Hansschlegelia beijingensis]MBB3971379.1 hypothetical protein [Hansschlegelia beijingensis]